MIARAFGIGCIVIVVAFFALPYIALFTVEPPAEAPPFTVSVDIEKKIIVPPSNEVRASLGSLVLATALIGFGDMTQTAASAIMATKLYGTLGSSTPRSMTIHSGMRTEQVAEALTRSLDWSKSQKQIFLDMSVEATNEGRFYPSTYIVVASTTPAEAYAIITRRFEERVLSRYTPEVEESVPLEDALRIASIVEREAGTRDEMRLIAGIFWNRIFADMRLQADATLQYARGTEKNGWWPVPRARDKFIESPYNTYQHWGLPPTPIASPSLAALQAALNPEVTDCFFFFHARGEFACSATYEEHVQKLKAIYGRGR